MKQQKLLTLILGLCLSLLLALPSWAEVNDRGDDISLADGDISLDTGVSATENGDIEPDFGTADRHVASTSSGSCTPIRSSYTYDQNFAWRWANTGSAAWYDCSANIPQGARVIFVGVEAYDNDPSGNVWLWFDELDFLSSTYTSFGGVQTSGTSTARQYLTTNNFNRTINHSVNSYSARVRVNGNSLTQFRSVFFVYQLQISPKPGGATFNDVPWSHPYHQHIEALVRSGITAGCGGGSYCPDAPLTRGQMAVFLSKALGLHWW